MGTLLLTQRVTQSLWDSWSSCRSLDWSTLFLLVYNVVSSTLKRCENWINLVRLTPNAAKTNGFWPDPGTTVIQPVKSVRKLGVHLDSELTMKTHISKVVSSGWNMGRGGRPPTTVGVRVSWRCLHHCVILRLAVLIQYDTQTDDNGYPRTASATRVKEKSSSRWGVLIQYWRVTDRQTNDDDDDW